MAQPLVSLIGTRSDPLLPDDAISASSNHTDLPSGRYHRTWVRKGHECGWPPCGIHPAPPALWIQFKLDAVTELHKIQVWKVDGTIDMVKVSYSMDLEHWKWYSPDLSCPDDHKLIPFIKAIFVRLHPSRSNGGMPGSLQAEMWGKKLTVFIREKVTMPHDPQCQYRTNLLHQLMLDDSFADCKIVCGSATMKCHRSILAAASPV